MKNSKVHLRDKAKCSWANSYSEENYNHIFDIDYVNQIIVEYEKHLNRGDRETTEFVRKLEILGIEICFPCYYRGLF